jgi:xanthine dehydrogenase accessory factor
VHLAARSLEASTIAALSLVTETDCTYVVERIVHNDFRVMLFGNGHVGRALVQVLGTLPCRVTWVDQREHAFPAVVPDNVAIVASEAPGDEVRHAQADTIFLVMTHSHGIDFEVTRAILARNDFRYFGLIGSAAKRTQFERRLLARGVAPEHLQRMTCPIGIGGIRSKQPGAIAIAVAAQLLQLRESAAMTASRRATAA